MQKEVKNWIDFRSLPFSIQVELVFLTAAIVAVGLIGFVADVIADPFNEIAKWAEKKCNKFVDNSPLKRYDSTQE